MDLFDQRYRAVGYLAVWAGMYPTYGDGLIQHGPESVVYKGYFSDYLVSLADHLLKNPEACEFLSLNWPQRTEPLFENMVFAFSVKYKEGKTQYYNLQDRKVSSADSKRHDKRWEEVPSWADGSVESAYRILLPSHENGLIAQFHLFKQCCYHAYKVLGYWGKQPLDYFGLRDTQPDVDTAWSALDAIVNAYREKSTAERLLQSYKYNLEIEEERKRAAESE